MQNQPLVTVYIPTFNRVELLKRAVKSVQDQTYQNLEIIIVDDCSNDGTHEYLEKVSKEDKRVRYFLKETNSGACVSRNIAIENARGEFITGLDDDDFFLKDRIELFVKNWDDQYSCLFSFNILKKDSVRSNRRFAMKNIVNSDDLLKANYIGNQIFTKTEYMRKLGGFDPQMQVWQDLEFWYRILSLGPGKRIKKDLYVVDMSHVHERISNKKGDRVLRSFEYFVQKHSLNNVQKKYLKTHMTNYRDIDLSLSVYFLKFLNFKSLGNLSLFLKMLSKSIDWKKSD
ncbi:glycosyltransferase [Acinetobacter towneri]|uniref:glycosyltransferase n=1 Tax=Acinetobacter towneri TaxID=202956 RepID=UPI0025753F60|nr:glycosyltransferase [Acinetobacter towneri]MDM1736810.1 glycosyltransferase [Acinetobacter towneri]